MTLRKKLNEPSTQIRIGLVFIGLVLSSLRSAERFANSLA